ncbi:hypothetical protein ACLOJK_026957 [Asimina triloba]
MATCQILMGREDGFAKLLPDLMGREDGVVRFLLLPIVPIEDDGKNACLDQMVQIAMMIRSTRFRSLPLPVKNGRETLIRDVACDDRQDVTAKNGFSQSPDLKKTLIGDEDDRVRPTRRKMLPSMPADAILWLAGSEEEECH